MRRPGAAGPAAPCGAGFLAATRGRNMTASSWATLTTVFLMAHFIVVGGVHTRALHPRIHEVSFFVTLVVTGIASLREIRLLSEQNALADRVNGLVT